jgi:transcriptional/translational regulatory protein YebC/TACO1
VANIRSAFKTHGGNLGNAGSVGFQFKHMGVFRLDAQELAQAGLKPDDLELELIDHGLEEMLDGQGEKGEAQVIVRSSFADLGRLQKALEEKHVKPVLAGAAYVPQNPLALPEAHEQEVLKLVDELEQDDDVQDVFTALA